MIRLLSRAKTSAAKAIQDFDLSKYQNQMINAEEFISRKLNDLKAGVATEGDAFKDLKVTIAKKTVPLKELAEVSQKSNSHWMIFVTEESWTSQIMKSIKSVFPHLSPSKKDQHTLVIPIPRMTIGRRDEILLELKEKVEGSKQTIRNIRALARSDMKKKGLTKDELFSNEKKINEMTQKSLEKVDNLFETKKQELK